MKAYKLLPSLLIPGSLSSAYAPDYNLQEPLIQPPHRQTPDSRRVVIRESSQSVSGSYPLYDLLSIATQSGSISVSVTPHSAPSEDPSHPASLELTSKSGSVHATLSHAFAGDDASFLPWAARPGIPARDYVTSVSAHSGSISGTFPLGIDTWLQSRSGGLGGIELVVMPVSTPGSRKLETVSHGGMQSIRIVDGGFWAAMEEPWWEGMVSRHESHSGSINVEYPNSWEGTIEVETGSGSASVTGRGVEIIREEQGRILARKGKGNGGKVVVRAGSGSVNLRFG
ncbi:hypothetical protein F5Y19DRAFT_419121 [Xylariaceae sp. FL1651]|nr:hypothetical protein F5Y19DRAFT_419121 [Xylariaceae sp. FL1651]